MKNSNMKIEESKQLKVKLKGSDSATFKSVLKKLNIEESRAGFKNSIFNDDEKKLIKKLASKIK